MARIILINGLPASGKTTLAARLSKNTGMPVFSKDEFKELLADTIGFKDHESARPLGSAGLAILFLIARKCLESNISLIIETDFSLGKESEAFVDYLRKQGVETREILCHAKGQVVADRFLARKRHPVHHTLEQEKLQKYIRTTLMKGRGPSLNTGHLLEVDTTDPSLIPYDKILAFVKK